MNRSYKQPNSFFLTLKAVFKKELIFITRSPAVLTYALLLPIAEILLLGYLLDLNPRQVATVVYDLSKSQESSQLIQQFINSNDFRITKFVESDKDLYDAIIKGQAKVAIKIPSDYAQKLLNLQSANILVLVDGSNANVSNQVLSSANRIALEKSLEKLKQNSLPLNTPIAVETHSAVLFNPDTKSSNFFLPALIVWVLPATTIFLAPLSMAKEKESGTLDQLSMTPISPAGLVIGKMLPYSLLALLLEFLIVISSYFLFHMPIKGSLFLLFIISIPFIFFDLGIGVAASANTNTQKETIESLFVIRVVPAFYLSGYIFPIDSMSETIQTITKFVPHRYAMESVRGILLRGAGIKELWFHLLILIIMSIFTLTLAFAIYRKKLS